MSAGTGLPAPGAQIRLDGRLVTVVAATATASGADLVVRRGDGTLADAQRSVATPSSGADVVRARSTFWRTQHRRLVSRVGGPPRPAGHGCRAAGWR